MKLISYSKLEIYNRKSTFQSLLTQVPNVLPTQNKSHRKERIELKERLSVVNFDGEKSLNALGQIKSVSYHNTTTTINEIHYIESSVFGFFIRNIKYINKNLVKRLSSHELIAKLRDQHRKSVDFIEKRAKKQASVMHKVFCICVSVDTKDDQKYSMKI